MGFLFLIILFIFCVGGCWAVATAIGYILFPDREEAHKPPTIHNHYYHTEQHLHITKDDLNITDTSRNQSPLE